MRLEIPSFSAIEVAFVIVMLRSFLLFLYLYRHFLVRILISLCQIFLQPNGRSRSKDGKYKYGCTKRQNFCRYR